MWDEGLCRPLVQPMLTKLNVQLLYWLLRSSLDCIVPLVMLMNHQLPREIKSCDLYDMYGLECLPLPLHVAMAPVRHSQVAADMTKNDFTASCFFWLPHDPVTKFWGSTTDRKPQADIQKVVADVSSCSGGNTCRAVLSHLLICWILLCSCFQWPHKKGGRAHFRYYF